LPPGPIADSSDRVRNLIALRARACPWHNLFKTSNLLQEPSTICRKLQSPSKTFNNLQEPSAINSAPGENEKRTQCRSDRRDQAPRQPGRAGSPPGGESPPRFSVQQEIPRRVRARTREFKPKRTHRKPSTTFKNLQQSAGIFSVSEQGKKRNEPTRRVAIRLQARSGLAKNAAHFRNLPKSSDFPRSISTTSPQSEQRGGSSTGDMAHLTSPQVPPPARFGRAFSSNGTPRESPLPATAGLDEAARSAEIIGRS
jgi:hypothetical protein